MKKKSLLLAIAAMSMAAVGVGTVGTFAWYTASAATVKGKQASSGGVSAVTSDYDAGTLTIVPTITLTRESSAAATVDFTDSEGQSFVAIQNTTDSKYYAALATASAGGYLDLTVSFAVYSTYDVEHPESNVFATAPQIQTIAGNSYEYTIAMSGRGKIGANENAMYAAVFNQSGEAKTINNENVANGTVSSVTASVTIATGGTATGTANSAIANVTYKVGIDGSTYTRNVSAGDEVNSDGNSSTAVQTTASLTWTSLQA